MALNYSVRPLFSRQWPEAQDNMDWDNVLPADPFGMDIDMSSTVTAISDLLESLEYGACGRSEVGGVSKGDCSFFAELNFLFSKPMDFQHPFSGTKRADMPICEELWHPFCTMDVDKDRRNEEGSRHHPFGHDGGFNFGGGFGFGFDFTCAMDTNGGNRRAFGVASDSVAGEPHLAALSAAFDLGGGEPHEADLSPDFDLDGEEPHESLSATFDLDGGEPHEALGFVIARLGVRDLLSVERVCKSMHDLANVPFMWKNLHIDQPLNDRITDDALVQLTSRSQGSLRCLSLVECLRITNDGLKRVLESNPKLTKLSVPGCTRLSIDGLVSGLRDFKSVASPGLNCLRIGGLYNVRQEHFDELMSLMGIQIHAQANHNKPLFYHTRNFYLSCEDERPIDMEICPVCKNLRMVYDCPAQSCPGKDGPKNSCRGCLICVSRCVQCGKCVVDSVYSENFCLEFLCKRCQERQDTQPSPSIHAVTHEPVSSFHG